MAGGGFATAPANGVEFEAKSTPIVIISCIMAATGGLMFGYDVGVSGRNTICIYIYIPFQGYIFFWLLQIFSSNVIK